MTTENKALAQRWFEEVWNRQQCESISKMFAADGLAHGLGADGGPLRGPQAFEGFHEAFLNAFPDLRVLLEDVIAEDDKVAIRWTLTGTLKGEGLGVRATGRPMKITGMSILRARNGVIVEAWNNFDVLGMHQQLGTLAQLYEK